MRVKTYALGITVSLGGTVAWFAGCGGTVAETTSGGNGGHVTTTTVTTGTTSSSSSSSTTSSSTTSSSGTTTGTSACDMACAHIQTCTGFTCMQAMIDCSTVGSQFDCIASCISATDCADLGVQTYQKCQGMCAGDGGGATDGGAGDGGAASQCGMCGVQKCGQAAFQSGCLQNMACQSWLQCIGACNMANPPTAGCFAACDAMYPTAKAQYDQIYMCTCMNCSNECSTVDPCAHGQDGGP